MSTNQKIAVITGANRGLGRAYALHLAKSGVDVVVTYRSNKPQADEVVAAITGTGRIAVALQLDTSVVNSFQDFADRLGAALQSGWERNTFDYLVNNAGHDLTASFPETTE
jgi:NAD(P)-dependent dehydrogenase (short-subunit alcohol dehydrogenase family)